MEMPKPSDGHRKLVPLVGRWQGEEEMEPSPWDPEGGTAVGRVTGRMALNGFALIFDYEQERDGAVTFTGHGVYTYDPKEDLYALSWFDCMGSPPEIFHGRFEGGVLQLSHGGPMHVRLTYDLSEPGWLATSMEMGPDGSTWNRLFRGRLKRLYA